MEILGIDVGGSGIKGAIVNTITGELISDRLRLATPKPAKPKKVAKTVGELVSQFKWDGPVGCGFPTVIVNGKSLTSGNIDPSWVGVMVKDLFKESTGLPFYVINDADAAGLAEMTFGVGHSRPQGMVILITIGTGLGSGVFYDGKLIPNIELGRIFGLDGQPIEFYAADSARKKEGLSYKQWGKRFDFFLNHIVRVCRPDLIILGGGASKKMDKFRKYLTVEVPILVAEKQNNAGIVGAAMFARICI